ncbi:MAG TPA: phage tail sheath subtilisin-like domain-containing protein, partial [Blastocatellia bacterium]|nr:phage tail sheath subtilisin-like domain-containing protein [Blastocatellia bacterium]
MASQYRSPGVYRQEVFLKPEARLETGVPGFVGLAGESSPTPPNQPVALSRKEEFATKFSLAAEGAGYLAEAVAGFFDNGGRRCYVARAANTEESGRETALLAALESLALWEDLDLLAVPDVMTLRSSPTGALDLEAVKRVQQAMLRQCAQLGTRLAILDAPPESDLNRLLQYRRDLTVGQAEPVNGAIYYPWLQIMGLRISGLGITGRSENRFVPPSGHVAGIYARTDAKAGVFKAPANEEVFGVLDLGVSDGGAETAIPLDNRSQDELNPEGINCLRAFRGRGLRVWGARTLSRQPEWRYVNVRRLFLTLRRWIEQNMAWASYEPNEARLWVRIQRELTIYLLKLWQDGALAGLTPEQAFYVKCDAETNPPEERELGRVVTEIGLAPGSPAEFIVIRI